MALTGLGVVVAAVVVRVKGIGDPPFDFHPTRQLYDAAMARGFWLDLGGSPPEGTRAAIDAARSGIIEPPVTQLGAAVLYRLLGDESLTAIRLVLSLIWVVGVWPLWRLMRRLGDAYGAALASVVWLFLPYGIFASRSFQPDGLLVVCIVVSVLASVRDDAERSRRTFVLAVAAGALAVFIKLTAVFAVWPVFVFLAIASSSWRAIVARRVLVYTAGVLMPALAYFFAGIAFGFTDRQEGGRILPHLLTERYFWDRWLLQIDAVVGLVGLVIVLAAVALARGQMRAVLGGLLVGYVAFGLLFTYHYATHDYYHLPLVLIVALSCGSLLSSVLDRMSPGHVTFMRAGAVFTVILALVMIPGASALQKVLEPAPPSWDDVVRRSTDAGEVLGHSPDVVFVAPVYGKTLQQWGYLAGAAWPDAADLRLEAMEGEPPLQPQERLDQMAADRGRPFEWVVVLQPTSLDDAPALQDYLADHASLEQQGEGWTAYRLHEPDRVP